MYKIQANASGTRYIEVSNTHFETLQKYSLLSNLVGSTGIIDETILDKLKPSKYMQILILIIASALTFNSDWNIIGVLIIYFFYKDSKIETKTLIIIASTTAIINFIATLDITSFTYLGIMLSIPILKSTNDERGYSNNLIKHIIKVSSM